MSMYKPGSLPSKNIMILKLTAVHMKLGIHSLLYKQNTAEHYNVFQKFRLIDYHFPRTPPFPPLLVFSFFMFQLQRESGIERN